MNGKKEDIRNFIPGLGVDDVGFASANDYQSPRTPSIESLFPGVGYEYHIKIHGLR